MSKQFIFGIGNSNTVNHEHNEIIIFPDKNTDSKKIYNDLKKTITDNLPDGEIFENNLFGKIALNGENFNYLVDLMDCFPKVLFLVGDGGVGKTTHLQKFQKDTLKNNSVLPIYISLCDKSNDDPIDKRIVKLYPAINGEIFSVEKLKGVFSSCHNGEHIVILLDGLNEYKGNREELFKDINDLCNYSSVSFIVTSRYPVSAHNITADRLVRVTEANIKHLCEDQVCEYLGIKTFPVHLDEKAVDLLTTPFYIKICKQIKINIGDCPNINASLLLYKYMQHNKKHFDEIGGQIIEKVFPYICYMRYKNDSPSEISGESFAISWFDANTITSAVNYFNENSSIVQRIDSEQVERVLIECNLIEKSESLGEIRYVFKHQNIRDTYAAYHVARITLLIANGMSNNTNFGNEIELHAELDDFKREITNSINVLCENHEGFKEKFFSSNDLVVLQVKLKLADTEEENMLNAQKFVDEYENPAVDADLKKALSEMYILALCILAKNYRLLRFSDKPNLESFGECFLCAQKAKKVYDDDNRNNSDGYNHIGKCLNSFMEYILNSNKDIDINADYLLIKKAISEIGFADTVLAKLGNDDLEINSGLQLVLNAAKKAYTSYCDREEYKRKVLWILALNYVSRAYMAEACLKNSAESLNLVAMILENNYNIRLHDKIKEKYGDDIIELQTYGQDRLNYSYALYDCASKLPHIVRGYSAQKKAIMLITGKVNRPDLKTIDEIKNDLKLSDYAGLPMTYYWEGRFYNDVIGSSSDAIKLFELEQKRVIDDGHFDINNLPRNIPLMLVKIELIPFHQMGDEEEHILDLLRKLVEELTYDNMDGILLCNEKHCGELCREINYIIDCLKCQKSNLYKKIAADRFWTTENTVKENLHRFLNNLKKLIEK